MPSPESRSSLPASKPWLLNVRSHELLGHRPGQLEVGLHARWIELCEIDYRSGGQMWFEWDQVYRGAPCRKVLMACWILGVYSYFRELHI